MFKTIGLVMLVAGWLIYTLLTESNSEPEDYTAPHQRIEFRTFDKSGRAFNLEINSRLQSMLQGFPPKLYPHGSNQCKAQLAKLSHSKVELAAFVINKDLFDHSVNHIEAFCVESSGLDKDCRERIEKNIPDDATAISRMQLLLNASIQCTQERRITPVQTIGPL